MKMPKEIRVGFYVLLLILSVQLIGNGVITILNLTSGYGLLPFTRAVYVVFGVAYIGIGSLGVYSAWRIYRRFHESDAD